jgi:hypothetical protein
VNNLALSHPVAATFGLFCNPESRRVEGFSSATARLLQQRPTLIPWLSVLETASWTRRIQDIPLFLRLESPGRNSRVELQMLRRGAEIADEEARFGWRRFSAGETSRLTMEPGFIAPMRQWFLGWRSVLREVDGWSRLAGAEAYWLNPPEEVISMFDKARTQRLFEKAGLPVPPSLGLPRDFDELWEAMRRGGHRRVFLKPCHGSSASGVVALESSDRQIQTFSTLELIDGPGGTRLYNSRRILNRRGVGEVRPLIDAACRERCIAQAWIPKAGIQGKPFDLRVVVVRGRARHVMVRLGRGPVTNSQLLGGKGDAGAVQERMGTETWQRMLRHCEKAMVACFPGSLYAGFDVLVEPNFRTAHLIEANAFGDLLPWNLHEGKTTYEWEVVEALERVNDNRVHAP